MDLGPLSKRRCLVSEETVYRSI
uniref:Uncharacterized protein n=1 Tax=Moniliophthora roreri TaxID=221103 RepID=A0A0W0FR00_MONRR